MPKLTAKQERFVAEYLKDLHAGNAAIRAGYSAKNAGSIASQLMEKTQIKSAILAARQEVIETSKVDAAWLLRRLADEATADLADLYDEHGALLPVKQWPKIWRQGLVQGLDVEELEEEGVKIGMVRKMRLDNRVKRLELIGKHIDVSAFVENVNHTGLDGLAERLERAAARGKGSDEAD